jgi:DnaJ-class molecular chaperone
MSKTTKRIYKWVVRLVSICMWCDGTGIDRVFTDKLCFTCKGQRGEWRRVRELVSEEIIR